VSILTGSDIDSWIIVHSEAVALCLSEQKNRWFRTINHDCFMVKMMITIIKWIGTF